MADEEVLSTGSEAGAGLEPEQKETEQTGQPVEQPQSTEPGAIDPKPTETPSKSTPARSSTSWANQRLIQKTVRDALNTQLTEQLMPLIEEIKKGQQPQVPTSQPVEQPDYNDLPGWIRRTVAEQVQKGLQQDLPKTFDKFKTQINGEFARTTSMQEARNYLKSQEDIGKDEQKLDEIKQVMHDNLLDYALESEPLEATQKAVKIWRAQKTNPNRPSPAELSTVGPGSVQPKKGTLSVQELLALQKKIAGPLTIEEKEKVEAQIDALTAPMP